MGWRCKLICLLIVYFAGFATAIYYFTPISPAQNAVCDSKGLPQAAAKSDQFAESLNVTLHKGVDCTKDAASKTAEYLKQKASEKSAAQNADTSP